MGLMAHVAGRPREWATHKCSPITIQTDRTNRGRSSNAGIGRGLRLMTGAASGPHSETAEMADQIDQIRRAHAQARPKAAVNPAFANCHIDREILLAEIKRLRMAIKEHYEVIFSSQRGHETSANKLHDAAFGTNYSGGSPDRDGEND
jgi:hypothetical protein